MRNNIYNKITLLLFFIFFVTHSFAGEQFNFDVTEIEILENGNKFIGSKKGTATSDDGIVIDADRFEYDKKLNILNAKGNVKINDTINKYIIYSDEVIYNKNNQIIFTINNSRGVSLVDNIIITASDFEYNKNLNLITAKGNVKVKDKDKNIELYSDYIKYLRNEDQIFTYDNSKAVDLEDSSQITAKDFEYYLKENLFSAKNNVIVENEIENYTINTEKIIYFLNEEKIITEGKTSAEVHSKYNFVSENVTFLKKIMNLSSEKKTTITDKTNLYNLERFNYQINKEQLKGENIIVSTNYNQPNSDRFYFSSGIINLKSQNFIAKNTKIKIHNTVFGNPENDPRLYGISSKKIDNIITVNKGVFTSCKESDNCPPWSIQASKVKHDKNKKQLIYDNAVLKIYNFPVLYFPKFFHPDPSVERQSGFLKPQINSSDELGDSIHIPYFHVISPNKDITFKPTLFNNGIKMYQNEYRQKNESSSFIADFSLTQGYKSKISDNKNSITHLFAKYYANLKFKNYIDSELNLSLQKVTSDTYLKVFDTNLPETELKPSSQNNLTSEIKLSLNHENFNFNTGTKLFESLGQSDNDKYQYILPYYDFNKNIYSKYFNGNLEFSSSGSNDLKNTNNLKSKIINNLKYESNDKVSKSGFVTNLNVHFKNSNTLGKKDSDYKSSPQIELMNIYEIASKLPLKKTKGDFNNFLTPKISFRFNPSDMKNYSDASKNVNVDNIFSINRLGFDDSFEKGRSLTLGIDYRKERLDDINKYFEFKLATALRDSEENFIPESSSLNKKNSNLFGSFESKFSKNFNIDYDFRVDNNYEKFEYNSVSTNLIFNNLETTFNFVKEDGLTGNESFLENSTVYKINDSNLISFNTRRNRKLNLTEFYDLLYEYKNDCLIASIKYKKNYYSDRDLKPSENLLLTLTLYPFTTYEHNETNLFKD